MSEVVRPRALHPVRTLFALAGGVLVVFVGVVGSAATGRSHDPAFLRRLLAVRSDTDSVAVDTSVLGRLRAAALAGDSALAGAFAPDSLDTDSLDTDSLDADSLGADSLRTDSLRADSLSAADALGVDSLGLDSLDADSLAMADSLVLPDTGLAPRYLPSWHRDFWTASPLQRRTRPLAPRLGNYWKHELVLDSTEHVYVARERVGVDDVRLPLRMNLDTYRRVRLSADMEEAWEQLIEQRAQQRANRSRGGLGFNIVVPGGQQSAFTTIFGKPEVDLRVNGQADIKAGFDYRKSELQANLTGNATQIDPDFKQDLRLGITGRIGDKLSVDVNWDTNNQFDYQNQLKLHYRGYEDEIIQNIEAGNVFLNTPSRLIRGGQSLFGIKSELQMGGLRLTTVASQQEGQANSLSIDGGAETTEFTLRPTDYDDATHFFLGYYFRNRWEDALSQPPNILLSDGFDGITKIEVWRLQSTTVEEQNVRQVVALVDLGESPELLTQANRFTREELPNEDRDQYQDHHYATILVPGSNEKPADDLKATFNLTASDFQFGRFKRLEPNRDYTFDNALGYITLTSRLPDNEALAVAFSYTANGETITVGQFSTETGGSTGSQNEDRLVLKLLRPVDLSPPAPAQNFNPAAWYLELRNIYKLPSSNLNATDFQLQVFYEPSGKTPIKQVPDIAPQATLLQALGLDRLNANGSPNPDDQFDFLSNLTIEPRNGRIIFPYLEPFGQRIDTLITMRGGGPDKKALYVFRNLYQQKKENARKDNQLDIYRIRGSYRGGVDAFYDLRAYAGLVQGSVNVTSGGSRLSEGVDYVVDYQSGTVTITNPAYLAAGRDINITYEQNALFNLQKKTLLGMRADYDFGERVDLGATLMRLNQKSPIDKFRIGEEPISNTIWGVDGSINLAPRWLTRAIDALPFVQTRAPSSIQITGEFAQLMPGASETIAFERTRRGLRDAGLDFKADELTGISFLDDFEGFENTFSLKQPGAWRLSSPPVTIGDPEIDGPIPGGDLLRSHRRATMAWYQLNQTIIRDLCAKVPDCPRDPAQRASLFPEIAEVHTNSVYPEKDVSGEVDKSLQTFDLYFDPYARGPYNYTDDLRDFLDRPENNWGGIMQRLPEGYTDFDVKNIEFLELIVKPFADNAAGDAGPDAKLYIDLGAISEDVIPDGKLNTEDGLSMTNLIAGDVTGNPPTRMPRGTQNHIIDVDDETNRTEDLGLDGLVSYDPSRYDETVLESVVFQDFLNALGDDPDPRFQAEKNKALLDPSGDDYHYFEDNYFDRPELYPREIYPNGASFQDRLTRWFPGYELNSIEAQNKLAPSSHTSFARGNSRVPDSEDLDLNSNVDTDNSYFQYALPLSLDSLRYLADPSRPDDYVVGEITDANGDGTGWYQIRIPFSNFTGREGFIQNFNRMKTIRIWTAGHRSPFTLRFAAIDLVGSQWQKSADITRERGDDPESEETRFTVSSYNNEENPNIYLTPSGTIVSQTRLASGRTQDAREQAMVLRVENLLPGQQRAIFRTQSQQGLDLLRYENLRMFAHTHGRLASGERLEDLPPGEARDKVRLFIRLGANETNDYYEYEMPLTPSDPAAAAAAHDADRLWMTNQDDGAGGRIDLNSVNVVLAALNQLKVARDQEGFRTDSVYWSDENEVSLQPPVPDFAPPGTRLGIRGNPSLARVNSVVIGVRNPADSTTVGNLPNRDPRDILADVEVWVNELRVSGYDQTNGMAAVANADIRLADLAGLKASVNWQQDGFGSLASTLAERDQNNILNWSVTADLNVDKFIPERFGWTIPVSFQIQRQNTTPRFSPQRGDIRLNDLVAQIDESDDLDEQVKADSIATVVEAAQTTTMTRSVTTRLQKTGSRSPLLRNTIDGLSFNYAWSDNSAHSPTQQFNDNWRWSSTLAYRLSIRRPRTVRPFWFLDALPVVGLLGDLQFNYLPQGLTFSASANRTFSQTQDRLRLGEALTMPVEAQYPLRPQHALGHRRNFSIQYNPFTFLNLTFDTNTNQSLNAVGVDTLYSMILVDTLGLEQRYEHLSAEQVAVMQDTTKGTRWTPFTIKRLDVKSSQEVVNRIFAGHPGLRTEDYAARFSGTFRPAFGKALNWLNLQDLVYSVQFGWQNGAVGNNTGAEVKNQVELRGGLTLRPQEFWRKFGFYKALEQAQRDADTKAAAAQRVRDQERRRRQEERQRRREEERRLRELEAAGQLTPEDSLRLTAPLPEAPAARPAAPADTLQEKRGFRLPLPNMKALLRQTILAVTGIRDFSVTYNGTFGSASSNVGRLGPDGSVDVAYTMLDALRGEGPSMGYRFGLQRRIPLGEFTGGAFDPGSLSRVLDPRLQVTDVIRDGHRLQARTALNPTQALQINLTWNTDWDESESWIHRPLVDALGEITGVASTLTANGNNRSSIWAFGASYLDLFERQRATFESDLTHDDTERPGIGDEDGDGRIVLTTGSVVDDFRGAFVRGLGTFDARGLLPIPMPGWQVSYSGLGKWPLLSRLVQNATLRHGYNADFSTDYRQNPIAQDPNRTIPLADYQIHYTLPSYEVGGIRINERFQPFIGVDLTWKGRLQTNFAWNRSNAYSLSTSTFEIGENKTSELTFTSTFQQQGMKLPFLRNRLNNRISLSLTVSYATISDKRYLLKNALIGSTRETFVLEEILSSEEYVKRLTASNRLTLTPQISYQFSNRVSANFSLKYENFRSEDSRTPSATTINGGFNIRVSIAN